MAHYHEGKGIDDYEGIQLKFIKRIEEFVQEKFKGSTKQEARLYIQRNIEEYKLNFNHWAINGYE